MRKKVLIILTVASIFTCSCRKSSTPQSPIVGRWNIVSDSVYAGVGVSNHLTVYNGKPGDFFEFAQGESIRMNEGIVLQISTYTFNKDSVIIYEFDDGLPGKGKLSPAADTLTITTGYFYTPGGAIGRTVHLLR